MAHAYFRTKSIDKLLASAELPEHRLRKSLGPWSLTALGIGAIVGAGIFVLPVQQRQANRFRCTTYLKRPCSKSFFTAGMRWVLRDVPEQALPSRCHS